MTIKKWSQLTVQIHKTGPNHQAGKSVAIATEGEQLVVCF